MACSTRHGRVPPVGGGVPGPAPARFAPVLAQARQDRPQARRPCRRGVFYPTPRSNAPQEATSRPAGRLVADGEGLDAFLERAQARELGGLARRPTHA